MATVSVPDELDRIIREALTGPPQSSSRLRPVDRRLAELLDLDPEKVRAKVVDDAGVVENRLGEGGIVNRKPDLVAILLQNETQLDRTAEKVARLTGPGTNIGASVIFVDIDQGWEVAALVAPEGTGIEARIREWYPEVEVRRPGGSDIDSLRALIERCRREIGYPRSEDHKQKGAREEVVHVLLEESLDAAIAKPDSFDLTSFRRIVSSAYGGAGNQSQINSYLSAGVETIPPLARTIKHLLYGPGDEVDRLDDVLDNAEWKVKGFGEALATKCLAIVYADRWLPLFTYRGENGKRAVMRLPELPVEPLDERGKSRAQLAKESNDALRNLLAPYYGDDSWGAMVFLFWLLKKREGDAELLPPEADVEDVGGRAPPAGGLGAACARTSGGQEADHLLRPTGDGEDLRRTETREVPRSGRPAPQDCPVPSVLCLRGLHRGLSAPRRRERERPLRANAGAAAAAREDRRGVS